MTMESNYTVYNMPALLSRVVKKAHRLNSTEWVPDPTWHKQVKEKMASLFLFYQTSGLLVEPESLPTTEHVVLKLNDFTQRGKAFLATGADDRWIVSFDRPGSKKLFSDVRYLEKQLAKVVAAEQ